MNSVARGLPEHLSGQELLDGIGVMVMVLDRSGKICGINRAGCRLLGRTSAELLGTDWFTSFLLPKNRQAALKRFAAVMDGTTGNLAEQEEILLDGAGRQRSVHLHHTVLTGEDGLPVSMLITVVEQDQRQRREVGMVDLQEDHPRERRLQDSRGMLRTIIDSFPDMVVIRNGKGEWLLANEFTLRLFGLVGVDYRGCSNRDVMSSSPFREFARLQSIRDEEAWLQGRPTRHDETLEDGQGEKRVFDVYRIPLFHRDGRRRALVVIGRDITEKNRVEQKYRSLFEQSPLPYMSLSPQGVVLVVNQAALDTLGYSKEELKGKRIIEFLTPESRKAFAEYYPRFAQGAPFSGNDYEILKPDGSVVRLEVKATLVRDAGGQPLLVHCVLLNVTRQRQLEEEMRASEERYRLLFENSPVGVINFDTDLRITDCNERFAALIGVSKDILCGLDMKTLEDKSVLPALESALRGKEGRRVGEYHTTHSDKVVFASMRTAPFYDSKGRIQGGIAIVEDITRQMQLEQQLNHAMKMEALGTLAGGIAHDFNNILSAVLGYAEIVNLELSPEDPIRKDVGQIIAAGTRAADLVRQILTFCREEEEDLRPVKLQLVVRETLKLLRSSLPTTIELKQEIDAHCGSVLADPTRMHQVLMNLCTNAKQAMGADKGELRVTLKEVVVGAGEVEDVHYPVGEGRWAELRVSDTGPGIDPEIKNRIFDPFFSTKEKGQGTGLGLSVTHGIVRSHGGEITVSSRPGHGAVFCVYLPLIEQESSTRETRARELNLPGGNERILLVDDEEALVNIIGRLLRNLGYEVTGCLSSREALEIFRKTPEGFDLLITDMTMPGYTGKELAEKVLALRPDLPIILCTGYSEYFGETEARTTGIRAFIAKPVDNHQLAELVRNLLDTQEDHAVS